MHHRHRQRKETRAGQLDSALRSAEAALSDRLPPNSLRECTEDSRFLSLCSDSAGDESGAPVVASDGIAFDKLPPALNPMAGELASKPERVRRKQLQLRSLALRVSREIRFQQERGVAVQVVEIGAGSGHLGLLLAYLHPSVEFVLCERKEHSVLCCEQRVRECSLHNVRVFSGDVREMRAGATLVVGLHLCGSLTDMALRLSSQLRASFVISPCCYGQLAKPPPSAALGTEDCELLAGVLEPSLLSTICSGADFVYSVAEDSSDADYLASRPFCAAKRSMRCVDWARLVRYMQGEPAARCMMASLRPLSCSQKNNVIIGRVGLW